MSKPIYQNVPYRFIEPEPDIEPGDDEPTAYGPVKYKDGEFRVREKDGVFAVYAGAKLAATIEV